MADLIRGNALIAQSGGPTAVINASLVGAVREAAENQNIIPQMFGSVNALEGCLTEKVINLFEVDGNVLEDVYDTPGAALGSSRKKVGKDISLEAILDFFSKRDIRYFFYIGGNDSADNARIINQEAKQRGYDLTTIHIPKTIDNDLRENDHTPGFGSAARYIAYAVLGDNYDNFSLPGVKINVVMGRSAGFLAASSALARPGISNDEAPHLIYTPEIPFSIDKFLGDLQVSFKKYGRSVVVVSEGINDGVGNYLAANGKFDNHGNPELDGQILAASLSNIIRASGLTKRVRADVFGYIQRSFPEMISATDQSEAGEVGRNAVKFALKGSREGSVAIKREPGKLYSVRYELVPLGNVARETRSMPREFMNEAGNHVTRAFLDYVRPLVGDLPVTETLFY